MGKKFNTGRLDYEEPQDEGGKVDPNEDPGRRSMSGTPPWTTDSESEAKGRVAMLLGQDFEDSEATSPREALVEAGFDVDVVSPQEDNVLIGKRKRAKLERSVTLEEARPEDFDALLLPGGRSPENLRTVPQAVAFVKHFVNEKKPIAAICHGPQLLISADGVKGRHLTGYESIVVDLENAGGTYHDRPVVVDGNLVTSRTPDDLELFNREILTHFDTTSDATH